MIPEHELLEQIADDERDFAFALQVFGGDLIRLKSALLRQASDGLIEVRLVGEARVLSVAELKAIWCDDNNFTDADWATSYAIQLTDEGHHHAFD